MLRKAGKHRGKEVSVQPGADPWNSQPRPIVEGEAPETGADIEEMEIYEEVHKQGGLKRVQFPSARQKPGRTFLHRAVPLLLTQGQVLPETLETQSLGRAPWIQRRVVMAHSTS